MYSNYTYLAFMAAFFLLIPFILHFFSRKTLNGPNKLWRILFPSWRFFDNLGQVPQLLFRYKEDNGTYSPWQNCLQPPQRSILNLFLNPSGNLHLACHGLLEKLLEEASRTETESSDQIISSVSYQLVEEIVRENVCRQTKVKLQAFQFKIVVYEMPLQNPYDVIISPEYGV